MTEYGFLIAIAGVLVAGAMSPGPSFFVVAQNALSRSRADGIATALGTGLGVAFFALLAGLGVVALLQAFPSVYLALTIVGSAYLMWISSKIWRGARQPLESIETNNDNAGKVKAGGAWASFMQGLAVQTSNPKTAIVIAGIFAAFVPSQPPPLTVPLVALIAFIVDFSWYAIVALSLSNPSTRAVYRSAKPYIDSAAALFIAFVAVKLILSQLAN